jgi:succinate dehydrogenase / fumarate reductase cytochrome b subunit
MRLFSDSIGRKAVMAVTGLLMVLFVIGHLLGNSTIFVRAINAYAFHLHELPLVVWPTRIVMGIAVLVHIYLAVVITLENQEAKPTKYAVARRLKATFAGRTMIWTGILLAAFIGYHLLQFTIRVTPGLVLGNDALNRFDVFGMVVAALASAPIAVIYVVGMIALFLHLSHGFQSTWQTLGLATTKTLPQFGTVGTWLSTLFLIGFGAIPVVILFGILK